MRFSLQEKDDFSDSESMQDMMNSVDSLDSEIDSRIVNYENESMRSEDEEDESIQESLRHLSLRSLFEADEEAEKAPDNNKQPESEAAEPDLPIDINVFTSKIARLVKNANELLPIQEVIINRAMNYLKENYDQSYADQMQDILDNQYGFDLSGKDELVDVPIAAGAGVKSAGG